MITGIVESVPMGLVLGATLIWLILVQGSDLQQAMIDYSINTIILLRNDFASPKLDLLGKVISQLGDKAVLGGSVFFAVHYLGKVEAYTVMTGFSLGVTFLGMLKLFYMEGRPFFLNGAIHPTSCKDLEYGFPSGHACVTASTYVTLYYCMCKRFTFLRDSSFLQFVGYLFLAGCLVLIAFTRLYEGVHSID